VLAHAVCPMQSACQHTMLTNRPLIDLITAQYVDSNRCIKHMSMPSVFVDEVVNLADPLQHQICACIHCLGALSFWALPPASTFGVCWQCTCRARCYKSIFLKRQTAGPCAIVDSCSRMGMLEDARESLCLKH